jgi:uncharacterized protein with von Willebrand factor type A (vWA) domain
VNWSDVFLGVIAIATLCMAVLQIGAAVVAARLAREAQQMLTSVQQEVRPIAAQVTAVAEEALRTAAITTAQADKIDRLVTDLAQRVDDTAAIVQKAIVTPAREGLAILAAIRAGFAALRARDLRPRTGRHAEEEDPLFIG